MPRQKKNRVAVEPRKKNAAPVFGATPPPPKRYRRDGDGHPAKKPVEWYEHKGKKRVNNPPVGLA